MDKYIGRLLDSRYETMERWPGFSQLVDTMGAGRDDKRLAEIVLDAYCGVGTIGLVAAGNAKQVLGVELNRDAVKDAIANARRNDITNCWFTAADAGEYMVDMAENGGHADVVFMDPPRAGSDERFLKSLLRLRPARVVYISCNPDTLARDLDVLCRGGYRAQYAQPVDMFPHTNHCEVVVSMSRAGSRL